MSSFGLQACNIWMYFFGSFVIFPDINNSLEPPVFGSSNGHFLGERRRAAIMDLLITLKYQIFIFLILYLEEFSNL